MYYFTENQNGMERYTDELISDFSNPVFQNGFKQYFSELDVKVENWDDLFRQINDDKDNLAFVRVNENKDIIGFILFQPIAFKSCFFEETYGLSVSFGWPPNIGIKGTVLNYLRLPKIIYAGRESLVPY